MEQTPAPATPSQTDTAATQATQPAAETATKSKSLYHAIVAVESPNGQHMIGTVTSNRLSELSKTLTNPIYKKVFGVIRGKAVSFREERAIKFTS